MASPNSSHALDFASATAATATFFAHQYLFAESGVLRAIQSLDLLPHHGCPSGGFWVAALTGTNKLLATAMPGGFHNGGFKEGPFRLPVPEALVPHTLTNILVFEIGVRYGQSKPSTEVQ